MTRAARTSRRRGRVRIAAALAGTATLGALVTVVLGTATLGALVTVVLGTAKSAGAWRAGPGGLMTPKATTDMPRAAVARIEIRLLSTGKTLLEAWF
ncbi:hypothetical protein ALI144C_04800 [Actinosynnema sp. ALI-1.44]|uniref:hypothetical protein n=1 Tax=Actinosynnema sp. ALI-1.44 TaxID=1933779 RepID=UPI00097BF634|nr:hypothetical protein [Actinosynnema sp. ALI-1.44]ONI89277.1 hypothetical protein ALI144C_04800 [Actinosynnema sp. ALI-1.44]